jgi:hypothetical protein
MTPSHFRILVVLGVRRDGQKVLLAIKQISDEVTPSQPKKYQALAERVTRHICLWPRMTVSPRYLRERCDVHQEPSRGPSPAPPGAARASSL